MKTLIIIALSILIQAQAGSEPVVDILALAGKTKAEIEKVLGKPTSETETKYGPTLHYKKGNTEIVFIDGKADSITVQDTDDVAFDPSALKSLELPITKPSSSNSFTLIFTTIENLLSVSIFKGEDKCEYAYIEVKTE